MDAELNATPHLHKGRSRFGASVDRWQEIEYFPGSIRIYTGAVDAGTGARQGNRDGGFGLRIFDGITPETEFTMHSSGRRLTASMWPTQKPQTRSMNRSTPHFRKTN